MAQVDSNVDVSHVCKLTRAARKQYFEGHFARAVELFERAATAAEALRQPDCLIVASLRGWCLETQECMTFSALSGDDSADAKLRAVAQVLALMQVHLPGVLETLERRRAAGTLLPDCCRAHKVAWDAHRRRTDPVASGEPKQYQKSFSWHAQHVGVAAYFEAARVAVLASHSLLARRVGRDEPLLCRCLVAVARALLLTLGRKAALGAVHSLYMTSAEPLFLVEFRTRLLPDLNPEEPRCTRLLAEWHKLVQSGVLYELEIEQTCKQSGRAVKSFVEAQAAKDAAVPLRACALPSCGAREAHVFHFKKCSGCDQVVYCSTAHQAEHWPAHKAACKAARQAARQAAAVGGGESQS